MSLRDKFGAMAGKFRSFVIPFGMDHPSNGGITGDLDPDDWPDDAAEEESEDADAK